MKASIFLSLLVLCLAFPNATFGRFGIVSFFAVGQLQENSSGAGQTQPSSVGTGASTNEKYPAISALFEGLSKVLAAGQWIFVTLIVCGFLGFLIHRNRVALGEFLDRFSKQATKVNIAQVGEIAISPSPPLLPENYSIPVVQLQGKTEEAPNKEKAVEEGGLAKSTSAEDGDADESVTKVDVTAGMDDAGKKRYAMFSAFYRSRSIEEVESAYKELSQTVEDEPQRTKDEIAYLKLKFDLGDTAAMRKLEKLSEGDIAPILALQHIATIYVENRDFNNAETKLAQALKLSTDETTTIRLTELLSDAVYKSGDSKRAFDIILNRLNGEISDEARYQLYKHLAGLYEEAKETRLRILALERAIRLRPNDADTLFRLAYQYAEDDENACAIVGYRAVLDYEPKNAIAHNNLGVSYERLNLKAAGNRHYAESFKLGETLAASNLAVLEMNAGFYDRAEEILKDAQSKPDVHENVASSMVSLINLKKQEESSSEKQIKMGNEARRFYAEFAECFFDRSGKPEQLEGTWRNVDDLDTNLTITCSTNEDKFEMRTEFVFRDYLIQGTLEGRASFVARWKVDTNAESDEVVLKDSVRGYCYFSEDFKSFVLYFPSDVKQKDEYTTDLRFRTPTTFSLVDPALSNVES